MIAEIYARKSTEQNVADDAKSVTRQVEQDSRQFQRCAGAKICGRQIDNQESLAFTDRPRVVHISR